MPHYYRPEKAGKEAANKSKERGGGRHVLMSRTSKLARYPYAREHFFCDVFVMMPARAQTAARSPASRSTAASSVSSFFEKEKRTSRFPSGFPGR